MMVTSMSRKIVKYYNKDLQKWVRLNEGPQGDKGDKGEKGDKGADGTVTFSNLTSSQKASLRGASFQYNWRGTKLGVKNSDEDKYTYADLAGRLNEDQEFEELKTQNKKLIESINELYLKIDNNIDKISELEAIIAQLNEKLKHISVYKQQITTEGDN